MVEAALKPAAELCQKLGAAVTLIHVIEDMLRLKCTAITT
jgi:hypothetical protein